jgi:hypothetical protein
VRNAIRNSAYHFSGKNWIRHGQWADKTTSLNEERLITKKRRKEDINKSGEKRRKTHLVNLVWKYGRWLAKEQGAVESEYRQPVKGIELILYYYLLLLRHADLCFSDVTYGISSDTLGAAVTLLCVASWKTSYSSSASLVHKICET